MLGQMTMQRCSAKLRHCFPKVMIPARSCKQCSCTSTVLVGGAGFSESEPSIAAVVGSMDRYLSRYAAEVQLQPHRLEIIQACSFPQAFQPMPATCQRPSVTSRLEVFLYLEMEVLHNVPGLVTFQKKAPCLDRSVFNASLHCHPDQGFIL